MSRNQKQAGLPAMAGASGNEQSATCKIPYLYLYRSEQNAQSRQLLCLHSMQETLRVRFLQALALFPLVALRRGYWMRIINIP